LIEDNPHVFRAITLRSKREMDKPYRLENRGTLAEGLKRLSQGGIDVIVLDLNLPDSKGIATFFEVQRRAAAVPIIVLSAVEDEEVAVQAVKGGAQDYLFKSDIKNNVLFRSIRYAIERKKMEQELWRLSVTDSMTGLFNQRHFYEQVQHEVSRAIRAKSMLCLILLDIDNFKLYNDTRGHLAGDRILRSVGSIIKDSIREEMDLAFRYGGDEFAVILPSTGFHEAVLIASRIKEKTERLIGDIKITFGVSSVDDCRLPDELIARADRRLYENKERSAHSVGAQPGTGGNP
jgi:diguanylate cyclase (GGDEF)-like protein